MTSSVSSLLHREEILKYLEFFRNGLWTFHLWSFSGSELSLSSSQSSLTLCMDQLKNPMQNRRHNCQQNSHNWKSQTWKERLQNTKLPREPISLISESLKPTCRRSDEPVKEPIRFQREPKLSVCWRRRCSKFWHVGPPGTVQISRVPVSFLLKELQEQNCQV